MSAPRLSATHHISQLSDLCDIKCWFKSIVKARFLIIVLSGSGSLHKVGTLRARGWLPCGHTPVSATRTDITVPRATDEDATITGRRSATPITDPCNLHNLLALLQYFAAGIERRMEFNPSTNDSDSNYHHHFFVLF